MTIDQNCFFLFNFSNYSSPVDGRATNNTGEIQAATWAINKVDNFPFHVNGLRLRTDSKFLINAATKWMRAWKRRGWRRVNDEPLANRDDFIDLDKAINNACMKVEFDYVPAHSGNPFNELADELAKKGAEVYRRNHYALRYCSDSSDSSGYYY